MRNFLLVIVSLFWMGVAPVLSQTYSLLIKGGHLIDPKNNLDEVMDVAVQDGKIAKVAKNIEAASAKLVIDAKGLYVTPGLIDIHGHVFHGADIEGQLQNGFVSLPPDAFTFRSGITTIVDAGSSGAKLFPLFKKNIIDKSATRVLAFLNISEEGMRADEMSVYQQNTSFMDPEMAANYAKHYKNIIVGIKVAHYHSSSFIAVDRAVEAGRLADIPVMVDFGGAKPRLSLKSLFLEHLRPGDIFTHAFGELVDVKETIVDLQTKKLEPFVWEARKRGVIFDVGHGGGSFAFSQALPASRAGFYPETISTDLHTGSMNSAMKNMLNVMSKFLAMNMPLTEVIKASTWMPAKVIKHEELGHLSVGAIADIAILNLRKGEFGFYDVARVKLTGKELLECEVTVKDGKVMYDLNARSMTELAR